MMTTLYVLLFFRAFGFLYSVLVVGFSVGFVVWCEDLYCCCCTIINHSYDFSGCVLIISKTWFLLFRFWKYLWNIPAKFESHKRTSCVSLSFESNENRGFDWFFENVFIRSLSLPCLFVCLFSATRTEKIVTVYFKNFSYFLVKNTKSSTKSK